MKELKIHVKREHELKKNSAISKSEDIDMQSLDVASLANWAQQLSSEISNNTSSQSEKSRFKCHMCERDFETQQTTT